MTSHGYTIFRRTKDGKEIGPYQVRVFVPKALQSRVGRKEIWKSLKILDLDVATRRAATIAGDLFAQWEHTAKPYGHAGPPSRRVPTKAELEEAAVAIGYNLPNEAAQEGRHSLRGKGRNMFEGHVNWVRSEFDEHAQATATGELEKFEDLADEAIDALDFDLPRGSEEYKEFCVLISKAQIAGLTEQVRRNAGDMEFKSESELIKRVEKRELSKAKPGETILDLFEVYAASLISAKKKRPSGIDQDRMVVTQFADFIGRNLAVSAIGYEVAKQFVDALPCIPAGYKKRKAYRDLTIQQAIEQGNRDGLATISLVTQQRYISTVSPFFTWLKSDRGGRRIKTNPFEGLHLDTRKLKKRNALPPFTADQISTIIHSPLFTGFQADGKEHLPGEKHADDWRFWLPLLCLFSGARIGEVAQLQIEDVYFLEGVWCVEFRSDEKAGQQTKNDNNRLVALHSKILKIGFLEFVERQKERAALDSNSQMFPELKPNSRNEFGGAPSKWFRLYLTKIGVKSPNDCDGFGSHSFRHTLADQLRAAGHLDDIFGPLIHGHYSGGVTGQYGQLRQGRPKMSRDLIESVEFVPISKGHVVEGGTPVDFSHLFLNF